MEVALAFPVAYLLSALAIRMTIPAAPRIGLVDRPGGHKQHEHHVPLVGGVGIFVAIAAVLIVGAYHQPDQQAFFGSLLIGATLLFVVGLIDDVYPLGVRIRFVAQAAAASITALWGGIMLHDFGALVSTQTLFLGVMALPVTLFATAGVINALNMVDGADGLSGSLSMVSLALLAIVAFNAGAEAYLAVTLTLLGAVGGFLVFNLRCCGRPRARVFMGDAGSTLLGFLFACLFVGLAQGESRAMSPVTALWLFAVPLFDTTAIMVRRVWLGRSPFSPDRWHLHHLLLDAGFTVPQGVLLMAALQLLFGVVGLIGWYQAVPEYLMFGAFVGLFTLYLHQVSRPWRCVPLLRQIHRNLDLPVAGVHSVFIGGLAQDIAEERLRALLAEHLTDYGYELFDYADPVTGQQQLYARVDIGCERTAPKVIRELRARLRPGDELEIRQFIPRDARHDRRQGHHGPDVEQRRVDRRSGVSKLIARHPPAAVSSASAAPPRRPADGPGRARVPQMYSQQAPVRHGKRH